MEDKTFLPFPLAVCFAPICEHHKNKTSQLLTTSGVILW